MKLENISLENIKTEDEVTMVRSIITKDCGAYFKAKTYDGKSITLAKNYVTKYFEKGYDETLYVIERTYSWFLGLFKYTIYYPIESEEYINWRKGLKNAI
ncbi:hypothetical protein D3C81_08350 [compost metagenome]